jgi:hypothetical protein
MAAKILAQAPNAAEYAYYGSLPTPLLWLDHRATVRAAAELLLLTKLCD